MKQRLVSAVAVIFCGAVLAMVALFGYSRYKAAQSVDAAYQAQLQNGAQQASDVGAAHMPAQLPSSPSAPDASATPRPGAQ
jgi:predicted negative regulator of RcsB-dependent stress response